MNRDVLLGFLLGVLLSIGVYWWYGPENKPVPLLSADERYSFVPVPASLRR